MSFTRKPSTFAPLISRLAIPLLVAALIIMAFALGTLFQRVQSLEGAKTTATPLAQAPPAPQPAGEPQALDSQKFADLASKGYSKGDPKAKVTIIEFADFQCPFCDRFHQEVEKSLDQNYIASGKVRFVYHDIAILGQESQWAAEAARCAGDQGKFWQYHDYLYDNQRGENQGAFSKENLKKFALALGLDRQQFNTCLDSAKHKNEVAQNLQDAQAIGVSRTPTSFVNGRLVLGAQPLDVFKNIIEEELKR